MLSATFDLCRASDADLTTFATEQCDVTRFDSTYCSLQEMIDEADRDGDGEVNEEEFFRIMKKTSLF